MSETKNRTTEENRPMSDDQIIEYAKARVKANVSKLPEAANQRYRLMTLPVILLRDEAGMSVNRIAKALEVSTDFVSRVIAFFDYCPPSTNAAEWSTSEIKERSEDHTIVELSAMTGLSVSEVSQIVSS